jgi:plastocyanin
MARTTAWRALIGVIALAMMSGASASAVPAPVKQITIAGMSYSSPQLTVKAGDTVEWINKDVVDHTATEKAAGVWNVSIAPGKSLKVVMKKAGTFDYYCRYHPNMVAKLIVTAPGKK